MDSLTDGDDFGMIAESLSEVSSRGDRLVTIKRVIGFNAGTFDGVAPSANYRQLLINVTVEDVTQLEVVASGGLVSLGDIKILTTFDVYQKDDTVYPYAADTTHPQQADELIYEGVAYHMVGKPFREFVAQGMDEVRSYWRRT